MMEPNEKGVSELVVAARKDIDDLVADEFLDGFPFGEKRVVPKDLTKSLANVLTEPVDSAIRNALRKNPRVVFSPTSVKGRPGPLSDKDIKQLVAAVERDLVAAYTRTAFIFEGKQEIPNNERNDVAGKLAWRVAGAISKTIRKNEKITSLPTRTVRRP